MSRKYKFHNKEGIYFVSFATVYWIDVFVRFNYFQVMIETLSFYLDKGLRIYCWCIMPSHVHLIFSDEGQQPQKLLGQIKSYSSKRLQKEIELTPESRKEWMFWMMERAAQKTSNVKHRMLWQHHNQPIELWSEAVIRQKVNYIHQNPVLAGFVREAEDWQYSRAKVYKENKADELKTVLFW